jgi:hypothetical protein
MYTSGVIHRYLLSSRKRQRPSHAIPVARRSSTIRPGKSSTSVMYDGKRPRSESRGRRVFGLNKASIGVTVGSIDRTAAMVLRSETSSTVLNDRSAVRCSCPRPLRLETDETCRLSSVHLSKLVVCSSVKTFMNADSRVSSLKLKEVIEASERALRARD